MSEILATSHEDTEEFERGYKLGLEHGREQERQRWENRIMKALNRFLNEE